MTRERLLTLLLILTLLGLAACGSGEKTTGQVADTDAAVSGRIEDGLRVLTFDPSLGKQDFRIYRGDYIRPEVAGGGGFTIEIPALDIARTFPVAADEHPYLKVPEAGSYAYRIGDLTGVIEAVDYVAASYREVSAAEAADVIATQDPFILDVRTEREFRAGHIAGATLIPVQVLKGRVGEIAAQKDRPVLVYCRSGNRSTVAAGILTAAGFKQVINLRKGIIEWQAEHRPLVR